MGDRVVGILPNLPETIIAMLATTSLGAIWSSCSPDFGVDAFRRSIRTIATQSIIYSGWLFF